jgi:hypothetical protein
MAERGVNGQWRRASTDSLDAATAALTEKIEALEVDPRMITVRYLERRRTLQYGVFCLSLPKGPFQTLASV